MKIELAPMEGITSYIYRNAINTYYGGIDTYFTPFISTHKDKKLNFKEKNEIRPENNKGLELVPQVLTANADEFLYTSGKIAEYGYGHINLNFGCPSGTVTAKDKGSGILRDLDKLERLLDEIFTKTTLKISVKTRLGYSNPDEWEQILRVYEKFPLEELIVHARVREDFYKGRARVDEFEFQSGDKCCSETRYSYNGDIYSVSDYLKICERFSKLDAIMIGRGLISRPWLAKEIKSFIVNDDEPVGVKTREGIDVFKKFNHALVEGYDEIMPGEKNTLFKLKELWIYMIDPFERGESMGDINAKKLIKSIRKCNSLVEYKAIINGL